METLYELLGALPRDDADELRAAFRRAVKGAHPDLHPGDPEAGQKFREIVRANEILSDEEQRAAYDHLLDLAHKEHRQQSAAKTMHRVATSVFALAVTGGLGLGGFLLYQGSPQFSAALNHLAGIAFARPSDFAGLTPSAHARTASAQTITTSTQATPPPAQTGRQTATATDAKIEASPDIKVVQTITIEPFAAEKRETANLSPDGILAVAAAPQAEADNAPTAAVGPPLEIAPSDAKVFRERGIFAYRSGDLDGAIAEFDRAIQMDPKFSAAYIDRGIVLYRLQKFERAFADIAQAKRIEKTNRGRAAQAAAKKPKAAIALGFPSFFQRRTAKLE